VVATSSGQGASHSVNCDDLAAPLLTIAAGYRVSGFVHWHIASFSHSANGRITLEADQWAAALLTTHEVAVWHRMLLGRNTVRAHRGGVIKLERIFFDPAVSNLMRSLLSRTASTMPSPNM
jgi:hypothetical protein